MDVTKPSALFQQALTRHHYQADSAQLQAIAALDRLFMQLQQRQHHPVHPERISWLRRWLPGRGQHSVPVVNRLRGVYLWGGVGRGKTWLMEVFYQALPGERKLRQHFHRFMYDLHHELTLKKGQEDPLHKIAQSLAARYDVICFDECMVTDITDAMLLGRLFTYLFAEGVVLVTTSNVAPDDLYRNGLQRARFLPAIAQIKQHCEVLNVDAGLDYRLRTLQQASIYHWPLSHNASAQMQQCFTQLTGERAPVSEHSLHVLHIHHRPLSVLAAQAGVVMVEFAELCQKARSPADYIELARQFHTVLLVNVRTMNSEQEDTARRFLALVDEFYAHRVKLIISAETAQNQLYQGNLLTFEYQRCYSRLQEMQSLDYLAQPHGV